LFKPNESLAPPNPAFDEPWQAQALALADGMVQGGIVSPDEWSQTLGAALHDATAQGKPDTAQTYYDAVLATLEELAENNAAISAADRATRRTQWENAYLATPHGQPVKLHPGNV